MEKIPVFVGLDYHSKSVQVCAVEAGGRMLANRRCGNSLLEIAAAIDPAWRVERAAVESCCGAADLAEGIGREPGWSITLAHPGYVARMKQSPDKTDYSDARMLADLQCVGYLPKVWLAPEERGAPDLAPILNRPPDVSPLTAREVSRLVNSVDNDEPACLDPAPPDPPPRQLSLFDTVDRPR